MKQNLSALMDGELFDDEAEALLGKLKGHADAGSHWHAYHLIGDALRQNDHLHIDVTATVRDSLKNEPVVLAPYARARQNARWIPLSVAASVLAMTVVAWMSVQIGRETSPQMAMRQAKSTMPDAGYAARRGLNDYLLAHQEFSPSNDVQGNVSYIRAVVRQ